MGDVMSVQTRSLTVKTGSLLLDSKNTRIPEDRRSEDQRSLVQELLEAEDVKGIATSIAKLGLFPNERLIVIPSNTGRNFVVLEGNRRLAAIKLLMNPGLAPTEHQVTYFRRLSEKADLPALGKTEVTIFPDRVAAAPVISSLHIGESKKRWSSLQQARFYRELVEEGLTPEEIAEREAGGVTLADIRNYLKSEKVHRVALTLDLDDETRKKVDDSRFPLTTLDRFLESKTGRNFLGIEADEKDGFKGVVHPDRFKAVLKHVVTDIANAKGLTRRINTDEDIARYVEDASAKIPKTPMRGAFDVASLFAKPGDTGTTTGNQVQPTQRPARTPKPSTSIVPRGFACNSTNDRVRAIFGELKSTRISDHRNSTGVMVRVLIDIALWHFYECQKHIQAVCDHYDKDGKRRNFNSTWTPPLRDLISYAVEQTLFTGMGAAGYKSVKTLAAKDADYFVTIEGFNAFTHNPYVTPSEGDLRALWQRAEPMLQIILNV